VKSPTTIRGRLGRRKGIIRVMRGTTRTLYNKCPLTGNGQKLNHTVKRIEASSLGGSVVGEDSM